MSAQIEELIEAAQAAHAAGKALESEQLALRVLELDSQSIQATVLLGVLAAKSGQAPTAIGYFQQVLALDPASFVAHLWLSMMYRQLQDSAKATEFGEKAHLIQPNDAHAYDNLGLCYMDEVRLVRAVNCFRRAAAIQGVLPSVFLHLGTAYYLLGRDGEAAAALKQEIQLNPKSLEAVLGLGQVMISQMDLEAAEGCARHAVAMHPESAAAQILLANALSENNKAKEGEKHLRRALRLKPNDAHAEAMLGQRLQSMGKFSEANEHLQRSLEFEPRQGFAYFAYVQNNKLGDRERPLVDRMELLAEKGNLPPRDLQFLKYGLGRALENLGEYEKAMRHFEEANQISRQLRFGSAVFDREDYASEFDWLINTFSKEFIEANRARGSTSDVPIFIVGMMRSGTTLVEQILSSHPEIQAAGEQIFWPSSKPELFGPEGRNFKPERLSEFGNAYLKHLDSIFPAATHITDKMPANYELLGPIHTSLPNARIIHMRRNPVDTCLSIFTTLNRAPIAYANDRENIVFAYRQYARLMAHWRDVLPEDRFIEVDYEDVVSDRETQARRLLEFVGLEWNESVMLHEANERSVNTPSLWQVRQPIYTTSIERWKRYEPWLGALAELIQ